MPTACLGAAVVMFYLGWLLTLMLKTSLMAQRQGWVLGLILGVFCPCASDSTMRELWASYAEPLRPESYKSILGDQLLGVIFLSTVGLPDVGSVHLPQLAKILHLGISASVPLWWGGSHCSLPAGINWNSRPPQAQWWLDRDIWSPGAPLRMVLAPSVPVGYLMQKKYYLVPIANASWWQKSPSVVGCKPAHSFAGIRGWRSVYHLFRASGCCFIPMHHQVIGRDPYGHPSTPLGFISLGSQMWHCLTSIARTHIWVGWHGWSGRPICA